MTEADATRNEVIEWARKHARDGFWSKSLMKFPPPAGWAWCGDRPPYRLTCIAFCDRVDKDDVREADLEVSQTVAPPEPDAAPEPENKA